MSKIDTLAEEIMEELQKIDGKDRLVEAMQLSFSIMNTLLHQVKDEYLMESRVATWDAFSLMMQETSDVTVREPENDS